jgi:hypothetical protein
MVKAVKFKNGDAIKIDCEGRTIDGVVEIVSENQAAMLIAYEAILAGFAGRMPVLRGEDGVYRDLFGHVELKIRWKGSP